jgi:RNA polymerase sigma-70 factor (ECF subfamily)
VEQAIRFSDLYQEHAPALYRYARMLQPEEAEDLVSETFLRLWLAEERVEWPTVRSYLFVILRNLVRQGRRRSWRRQTLDFDVAGTQDLEAEASARQELDALRRHLEDGPPVDREALLLQAVGGLTYAEISAILAVPVATLKVKVHRTRMKLAEAMKERGRT